MNTPHRLFKHLNPVLRTVHSWLLPLIIFLLPWQARWVAIPGNIHNTPWEYGTVSLYALDFFVVLFVLLSIWLHHDKWKGEALRTNELLAIFLLVIAWCSLFFSTNALSTLFWWWKLAEGVALFLTIQRVPGISSLRNGCALLYAGLIQSGFALYQMSTQYITGFSWLGMAMQDPATPGTVVIDTGAGRILRSYGTFPHPNMLGGFLVVCLIVGLWIYFTEQSYKVRFLYAAILVILSTGLWTTFSRQSWVALACALVITIGITFIKKEVFPRTVTLGILYCILPILVFSFLFPQFVTTRFHTEQPLEERSITERKEYTTQATELLTTNWLTGIGLGNYTGYQQKQDTKKHISKPTWDYQPVHNIYLLIWSELGIIGLLTFLFFIISVFTSSESLVYPNSFPWRIVLSALLIIGLFDHYLWSLHFGILLFWLICGLIIRQK